MREVLIWKDLKHPHVHEFYGACNTVAQPFMISRYNRKGNILDYLKSNPNADLILLASIFYKEACIDSPDGEYY